MTRDRYLSVTNCDSKLSNFSNVCRQAKLNIFLRFSKVSKFYKGCVFGYRLSHTMNSKLPLYYILFLCCTCCSKYKSIRQMINGNCALTPVINYSHKGKKLFNMIYRLVFRPVPLQFLLLSFTKQKFSCLTRSRTKS